MNTIYEIIERKKQGIDCTETESATIKTWLKELELPFEQPTYNDIQELFPIEYSKYIDETIKNTHKMKTETCLNCGHSNVNGIIFNDKLGPYMVCDSCGSSFDVNVPKPQNNATMKVLKRRQVTEVITKRMVSHEVFFDNSVYIRTITITITVPYMDCEPKISKPKVQWSVYVSRNTIRELSVSEANALGLNKKFEALDIISRNGNN